MDKKNQVLMSVLGVFALVIVTVGVSYAFFSYSRTGTTTSTITSGDISFTYLEGAEASLTNAFPVADQYGAADTTGAYKFSVNTTYTGPAEMKYDVYLVDANYGGEVTVKQYEFSEGGIVKKENGVPVYTEITKPAEFFRHDQIKFNLLSRASNDAGATESNVTTDLKNSSVGVGTTTTGVLVSNYLTGNSTETTAVEGKIIEGKKITNGQTHYYTLRLWLNDDNTTNSNVDYSNTAKTDDYTDEYNDAQVSISSFSGYTYSLKVKVTANATNTYTGTTVQQ